MNADSPRIAVALETSTRRASIAVQRAGRTLSASLESDRAHASDLLPALERLIGELGGSPRELGTVLVGTGPGSYTGLRVGIATALGLARASGARILGVPSGETLCFGELEPGAELVLLLDARSSALYFARYRRTLNEVEVLDAPRVIAPAEAQALLPAGTAIFGDSTVAATACLDASARARLRTDAMPRATALLELGMLRLAGGAGQSLSAVEPLYLRPFAATERRR